MSPIIVRWEVWASQQELIWCWGDPLGLLPILLRNITVFRWIKHLTWNEGEFRSKVRTIKIVFSSTYNSHRSTSLSGSINVPRNNGKTIFLYNISEPYTIVYEDKWIETESSMYMMDVSLISPSWRGEMVRYVSLAWLFTPYCYLQFYIWKTSSN